MNLHSCARSCPRSRELLVNRILEQGWTVKTAAEVYSPVDGEVIEANDNMADDLELISQPVADGGWIAKIKITDASQLEELMDEAAYQEFLKTVD